MQKRRRVSKRKHTEEEAPSVETPIHKKPNISVVFEWGSKQPKPVDKEILSYALSTGGALAQLSDTEEANAIRNNLFVEIAEGEASLACDKRGSRVLQNLFKHHNSSDEVSSQHILALCERLKPYIGHLVYDPFASHVIQTIAENDVATLWKVELCQQMSKVDEWWPLMHDPCGTHVARSLVLFLAKQPEPRDESLFTSLMNATQEDLSSACKNQAAGPFLALVVQSLLSADQRNALVAKLLDCSLKEWDVLLQHPVSSRVMEAFASGDAVQQWKSHVYDNLHRFVFHSIANFVAQRLVERETDLTQMQRIVEACPVSALVERDRVGVLNAMVKSVSTHPLLEAKLLDDLLKADVLAKAISSRHQQQRRSEGEGSEMHAGLLETLFLVFTFASLSNCKKLANPVLALESSVLMRIAKDSLGGKKVLEPLLTREELGTDLAKRFKTKFVDLVMDKYGVFVARKAFMLLRKKDKLVTMEEEIVPNESKINGAGHWGRSFLQLVEIAEYKSNAKMWAEKMEESAKDKETVKLTKQLKWKKDLGL